MHHVSTVIGHLTRDPELRVLQNGQVVTKFRIAASRKRQASGQEDEQLRWEDFDSLFLDVECWGQLARNVHATLSKGRPAICLGHLVTNEWMANEQRQSRTVLKAQFVGLDLNKFCATSYRSFITEGEESEVVVEETPADEVRLEKAAKVAFAEGESEPAPAF